MQSQNLLVTLTKQPNAINLPVDIGLLLQYGNSPTAIILAIAFILWILRPVMLKRK
jgi:hypothetical protein